MVLDLKEPEIFLANPTLNDEIKKFVKRYSLKS